MTLNRYAVGDEITIQAYIERNGAPDIVAGDTVQAEMLRPDRTALAAGTAVVTGSIVDQPTALVSATWDQSTTGAIVPGRYLIQWQITRGGKRATYEGGSIEIYASLIP